MRGPDEHSHPELDLEEIIADLANQASDLHALDETKLRLTMGRILAAGAEIVGWKKSELTLIVDKNGQPPTPEAFAGTELYGTGFGAYNLSQLSADFFEAYSWPVSDLRNAPAYVFHERRPIQIYDDVQWLGRLRDSTTYFRPGVLQAAITNLEELRRSKPEYQSKVESWIAELRRNPSHLSDFYSVRKFCWVTGCPFVGDRDDARDFSDFMSGHVFPVVRRYKGQDQCIAYIVMYRRGDLRPGDLDPTRGPVPQETMERAQAIVNRLVLPIQLIVYSYSLQRATKREISEREHRARAEQTELVAGQLAHEVRGEMSPLVMALDSLRASVPDADLFEKLEAMLLKTHREATTEEDRRAIEKLAEWTQQYSRDGRVVATVEALGGVGSRVSALVESVLDYALIARESQDGMNPVDLAALTRDLAGEFRPDRVLVESDRAELVVLGTRERLRQAVLNLVQNAVEATEAAQGPGRFPGPVRVRLTTTAGEARVDIVDEGVGMTEELRAKLFTPMFTTKPTKGHGLGLVLAQRIVNAHGGHIDVSSVPGKGSVFRVTLPATSGGARR